MGFMIMVVSMILGLALEVVGILNLRENHLNKLINVLLILVGIVFIAISVWLGLPK